MQVGQAPKHSIRHLHIKQRADIRVTTSLTELMNPGLTKPLVTWLTLVLTKRWRKVWEMHKHHIAQLLYTGITNSLANWLDVLPQFMSNNYSTLVLTNRWRKVRKIHKHHVAQLLYTGITNSLANWLDLFPKFMSNNYCTMVWPNHWLTGCRCYRNGDNKNKKQ